MTNDSVFSNSKAVTITRRHHSFGLQFKPAAIS